MREATFEQMSVFTLFHVCRLCVFVRPTLTPPLRKAIGILQRQSDLLTNLGKHQHPKWRQNRDRTGEIGSRKTSAVQLEFSADTPRCTCSEYYLVCYSRWAITVYGEVPIKEEIWLASEDLRILCCYLLFSLQGYYHLKMCFMCLVVQKAFLIQDISTGEFASWHQGYSISLLNWQYFSIICVLMRDIGTVFFFFL